MRNNKIKKGFALLAALALCGCQYDPHAHTYTTHKPKVEEIVGEYELDAIYMDHYAPGIRDKIRALPRPPTIRILADGTFVAERFPYFGEVRPGFEYRFEDFRTIDSKWTPEVVGSIGDGSGAIKDHHGIRLDGLPIHLIHAGFTGTRKVDGLIFGFGDPDSGDAIIYKKK